MVVKKQWLEDFVRELGAQKILPPFRLVEAAQNVQQIPRAIYDEVDVVVFQEDIETALASLPEYLSNHLSQLSNVSQRQASNLSDAVDPDNVFTAHHVTSKMEVGGDRKG
jgi:hypothetical protein